MALKVIPIYGRGGDNTDPRQKAQSLGNKEEDKDGPVPRRPAGQRIAPVLVSICNLHILQQQQNLSSTAWVQTDLNPAFRGVTW